MEHLDTIEMLCKGVRFMGKWAVYIDNSLEPEEQAWKEVEERITDPETLERLIFGGVFLFETEEECFSFFHIFNSGAIYSSRLFAMVISPSGEIQTENT